VSPARVCYLAAFHAAEDVLFNNIIAGRGSKELFDNLDVFPERAWLVLLEYCLSFAVPSNEDESLSRHLL